MNPRHADYDTAPAVALESCLPDGLFASDVQGRSRAYTALVGAGMDPAQDAKATGMANA